MIMKRERRKQSCGGRGRWGLSRFRAFSSSAEHDLYTQPWLDFFQQSDRCRQSYVLKKEQKLKMMDLR
jgi:hypothetical protein